MERYLNGIKRTVAKEQADTGVVRLLLASGGTQRMRYAAPIVFRGQIAADWDDDAECVPEHAHRTMAPFPLGGNPADEDNLELII